METKGAISSVLTFSNCLSFKFLFPEKDKNIKAFSFTAINIFSKIIPRKGKALTPNE